MITRAERQLLSEAHATAAMAAESDADGTGSQREAVDVVERANAYIARWNSPSDTDASPYGALIRDLLAEVERLTRERDEALLQSQAEEFGHNECADALRAALARLSAPKR